MREPRAFVTGAAGFIGSTLVDRLLADGWVVTGLDNFDGYYPRAQKERNLALARTTRRFHFVEGDTRDREALMSAIQASGCTVVYDLAARAGVRPSIAAPLEYIDVNVRGLQNTLSAVAAVKARLVFASSSSIYGADPRQPFTEDQARGRPESPYGATKVAGEALANAHHALSGLPVGIARLFTVYGPRQRPDLAIHHFAMQMLRGQPIDLYDQGNGLRDYTYVDDVVEALVRLGQAAKPHLLVNIGSHNPVTTAQMVDELEVALGVFAQRRLLPAQPGDVPATYADVELARETLGWAPTVPFATGIGRFCSWLLSEHHEAATLRAEHDPSGAVPTDS
jgi:UDP-glucuronate 4-epimerase